MKKVFSICFFAVLLIQLIACSKEDESLDFYSDSPTFYISGTLAGNSFDLVAGENNFELLTDFVIGQDSVLILRGRMQSTDTANLEALAIWFRTNARINSNSLNININQELEQAQYPFSTTNITSARPGEFSITTTAETGGTNYVWTYPQGDYNGIQNTISVQNQNTVLPISLSADIGNCTSEITHYINPYNDCDASFDLSVNTLGMVSATVKPRNGETPSSINWFINGLGVQLGSGNTLPLSSANSIECKAEFTFADGCTKTVSRTFEKALLANGICNTDFTYQVDAVTQLNPEQFGTVEIIYTNAAGKRFTSKHGNVVGQFNIENVGDFQRNTQEMATKRFTFSANANLLANDNQEINLSRLFGNFAVAYPD